MRLKHPKLTPFIAVVGAAALTGTLSGLLETRSPASAAQAAASATSAPLPQGSEVVTLNPADFSTNITNPYMPLRPGSTWVYRATDTKGVREKVVIRVTNTTKKIANGITARVVTDTVTVGGKPREVTTDWFAQDRAGNVWYLGEAVSNYERGVLVDHEGSFEAGVDGAQPGVAMPANPKPGMHYRQEYLKGVAEDQGAVVTVGKERVQVPFGFFDSRLVMTRDTVPLEPKVEELKFFARGVGMLLSVHTDGDGGRAELVSFTPGK
jgi:hypothetical protein